MKALEEIDKYLFAPVAAARPYLLIKAVLFVLALDAWAVMIEHGGRYGVGEFNVSHFGWLDALQPVPSSGLYVGLVLFAGLLAFAIAAGGTQRIALGVLAALYTYGWMMSMLDSYQHHYLLSLVLICFVGWPEISAGQVFGRTSSRDAAAVGKKRKKRVRTPAERWATGPAATSWAYTLFCASVAIVYGWTAVSKTEEEWRLGLALQRIAPEPMQPFEEYFVGRWGMESSTFWELLGHSVIMVQVVIAAGYLAAPLRDRGDRAIAVLCSVAFAAAVSFHLGAEYLELRIGWFSWYMVAIAAVCFLPAPALWAFGKAVTWPIRIAGEAWESAVNEEGFGAAIPAAVGAGAIAITAGYLVDMPGSVAAGILAAIATVGAVVFLVVRGRVPETLRWIAAVAGGAVLMWLAVAATDVRYDFYRKVGGVMRRHGEWAAAYDAYRKANLYAPPGQDRREKEEEMRRMIELEGERREGP